MPANRHRLSLVAAPHGENAASGARAPVGQQQQEVDDTDEAVTVEVGGVTRVRSPCGKQREEVRDADRAVAVEVPGALARVRDAIAVGVRDRADEFADSLRAFVGDRGIEKALLPNCPE